MIPSDDRRKQVFLKHYRKSGIVQHAVEEANTELGSLQPGDEGYIWRRSVLSWRETDEDFDDMCREAEQDAADLLEREAMRRAKEGWDEPVFNRDGDEVGTIRKYDGTLLIFLLKGFNPQKYGDRTRVELGVASSPLAIGSARDALAEKLTLLVERRKAAALLTDGSGRPMLDASFTEIKDAREESEDRAFSSGNQESNPVSGGTEDDG